MRTNSNFCAIVIAMTMAIIHAPKQAYAVFYIPATTIDNTEAFYESASANWPDIHRSLDGQISTLSSDRDYGAYVLMTSIYGAPVPAAFDLQYMHSLMDKIRDIGPRTWDDEQLQSISAAYQAAHQSAYVVSGSASLAFATEHVLAMVLPSLLLLKSLSIL
ncbi:hypothetical protein IW140_003286 [Coemansia sp. RSA 1813]|nr:hypothetical protein EV178_002905 [Coemansia sp. RSA 1646]KAJ1771696.1 hypothetical protein LPJ74_002123 [Coemansia sp. RSA 1843]KAJ2089668.1 hypothetical protein IW138_003266 [Coemansia sp. RSA 986]KAJ2214136.1 hypothetical protein EV179_003275 [Coemansia sp. RSA 487]KAJ2569194.1 hypothetical protein IW140_003286 [Coemansia sp. RSA 1813]